MATSRRNRAAKRGILRIGPVICAVLLLTGCASTPVASTPAPTATPSLAVSAVPAPSLPAIPSPLVAGSPPAGSQASQPLTHVVAAWVAITPGMVPLMMAQEGGYFREQGLDVDLRHINGSTTGLASLLSGEIQVLEASANVVVPADAQGAQTRVIAGFVNQSTLLAMTVPSITDPSQLKGTTWAVTVLGGLDYWDLVTMLQHFGLTADDVNIITASDVPGQIAAVESGQAQGITVSPPNDVLAEKEAGMHQFFDVGTLPPIQNTGLIVTESTFQNNPDTLRRFIQACIEGIYRFKTDETFGEQVMDKYLGYTDPEITQAGYAYYAKAFTREPYPTVPGMQRLIEEIATQSPQVSSLDVNTMIDSSLVDEIVKSGFISNLYGPG